MSDWREERAHLEATRGERDGFRVVEVGPDVPATASEPESKREVDHAAELRQARAALTHFLPAYRRGLDVLSHGGYTRSAAGSFDRRPPGRPGPRPPANTDAEPRASLIRATQALSMASLLLVSDWDWPHDPTAWQPDGICHVADAETRAWVFRGGSPDWLAAEDVTTPVLPDYEVQVGVERVRGLLGELEPVDWQTDADDVDRANIERICFEVREAVRGLKAAGVWRMPRGADERLARRPRCPRGWCGNQVEPRGDGWRGLCRSCRQREEAARKANPQPECERCA